MGGGVGGGGSGGMLRTVGRAVTTTRTGVTNLQEPISSSSSSTSTTTSPTSPTAANSRPAHQNRNGGNQLSLSAAAALTASPFGSHNVPVPAHYGVPSWSSFGVGSGGGSSCCDEYEWVSVDGCEEDFDKSHGFLVDDFTLGPVPSLEEVNTAVSALQQVFDPASCPRLVRDKFASNSDRDTELDWIEPSLCLSNSRMLQPYPADRVYDAFHLLQTEPSIQRMVISLSSDKDVWNAVLNNEAVRELKESFNAAENSGSESSDENSDDTNPAINIIRWIFVNTQAKIMEVIDKITNIVNDLFKPPGDENATKGAAAASASDSFEKKLRTSFLLSIVVLLVVVVTRTSRA